MRHESEDKVSWIIFTIIITVFLISVFFLVLFPDLHGKSAEYQKKMTGKSTWSVISLFDDKNDGNNQIKMKLPHNVTSQNITSKSDIARSKVSITIPGADAAYPQDYKMIGSTGRMKDILFTYSSTGDTFEFCFNKFYEAKLSEKNGWLCIDFKRPNEIYKKIIIIDASCGEGVAQKSDDSQYERDIALDIVKRIKTRFSESTPKGTKVYYTREDNMIMSPEERAKICNSIRADIFLSVALNSTSSGRTSSMQGAAAEYLTTDDTGQGKIFASECLDGLLRNLGCKNRGLIPGDEEAILKEKHTVSALVRVGYLSNYDERSKLITSEYQEAAAEGLYQAILKQLDQQQMDQQ